MQTLQPLPHHLSTNVHSAYLPRATTISALDRHQNNAASPPLRTQNGNLSLLLPQNPEKLQKQHKLDTLEISVQNKRTPQYPGSILSNPSVLERLKSSVGASADDDDEMLLKALEVRRKVTAEIFKEAMKKGKFAITYTENLVGDVQEFLDYVMVKAVYMKRSDEFSRCSYNERVRFFLDECGVVPLIRWLKHNSLSYRQIAKLICASKGNLDSIRHMAEWLKTIHVRGRFIGVALTRAGENTLDRSIEELNEIIDFMEDNGLRKDWMGYFVSRCPEILSFSVEEAKSRTEFYLSMGISKNDFGTMLFDCPKVFGYLSMEEMNQKVAYLKEFGLNTEDVGRLLAHKPQLMACSVEDRWKPLVKYFYYLGISKDGMRRILTMKPMVFCVDLEETIVPKVQFLRDIGVEDDSIGTMLVRFPSLLTYSLYKKIRPVVIFLLTKAGVSQRNIGKVVALGPELLGCSIANKLDQNVKYFLSLGITVDQLGEMVSSFPMLLRYNIDVLSPKYRYLRRTMIRPLKEVIEFPRFFSYSLEDRIIPRHKIMVENRINFKLRYMLASTDEEFDARVKEAVERQAHKI